MKVVKIGRSRYKTFLLILAAIGFVVAGGWMLITTEFDTFVKIIGLVSILFFGSAIPLGIKKLVANGDGLWLSSRAIIIEPESSQALTLLWSEMIGFGEVNIKGAKIILIYIKHPESKINSESNPLKRKLMQLNNRRYKTPYNITSGGLNISHKKLLTIVNQFHSKYTNEERRS